MIQIAIIGIGAGAAAALLFASVTSGTWLSIPLFYLAPLPIMIAGLGWSHWAALTAALAGAIGLGVGFRHRLPARFCSPAPASRRGGSAISQCLPARSRPPTAAARVPLRLNGIRPAGLSYGRPSLARSGRDCRHSQFRHRCRQLPRRPARCAQRHYARQQRHAGHADAGE